MAEIIDQQNLTANLGVGFGDTLNGRDYMAMGFIPTMDNITAVAFQIRSKPFGADLGFVVWVDNANASFYPTGTVFVGIGGFTEIPNAQLVTGSLTKYSLASQVSLIAGQRYALCFAPYNVVGNYWSVGYVDWETSVANPYANGRRVHANASFASWSAPDGGNADIKFRTYGNEAQTPFLPILGVQ